eukprot:Phypoly_transcript_13488.p1 GENE.Phypoly_transcript_13488~~Phypoly_transcript_13488.p1  ORF type:complete len:244 (+),score=13.78 Phypoly_transcript_13488:205-936(+)
MNHTPHDAYKLLFEAHAQGSANPDEVQRLAGHKHLFGRIIRAKDKEGFTIMSEPWKKLSWVMDADGLCGLLGKNGNQMLKETGSQSEWINFKLKQGFTFKLAVFTRDPSVCKLATWENLIPLMNMSYPDMDFSHLEKYISDLTSIAYHDLNKQWTHDIMEVYYCGRDDPRYLTAERFKQIKNPTIADFRAFLLHEIGLGVLYDGRGFTVTEEGAIGLPEYLTPSVPLSSIPHVLIDLTVLPVE